MRRIVGMLVLGATACAPKTSPPQAPAPASETADIPQTPSQDTGVRSTSFSVEDPTMRPAEVVVDEEGRVRLAVTDNHGRVVLWELGDGGLERIRETQHQAPKLPSLIAYDGVNDAVWRLYVDRTSYLELPDRSEATEENPTAVPLGGRSRGRSGTSSYRVVNDSGVETRVNLCAPKRPSVPPKRRSSRGRGLPAPGKKETRRFCDHSIGLMRADRRGVVLAGGLEAGGKPSRPWLGLVNTKGALAWEQSLDVDAAGFGGSIRDIVVTEEELYAVAVLTMSIGSPTALAYLVRIDPTDGEVRNQILPGRIIEGAQVAMASEQDRLWVALYRSSHKVSVLELDRNGTLQAEHEVPLEGPVRRRAITAVNATRAGLRIGVVRTVYGETESDTIEFVALDRQGDVIQRQQGKLPAPQHAHRARWVGEDLIVSAVSKNGAAVHSFPFSFGGARL